MEHQEKGQGAKLGGFTQLFVRAACLPRQCVWKLCAERALLSLPHTAGRASVEWRPPRSSTGKPHCDGVAERSGLEELSPDRPVSPCTANAVGLAAYSHDNWLPEHQMCAERGERRMESGPAGGTEEPLFGPGKADALPIKVPSIEEGTKGATKAT
ncbi:hypothetical protein EYF80_002408 [Liparis tanakae]|uniref:Uncharacterized protein n=1 Tax=Liparis tanakae TaxID=230148 RepID=A0A4Z2JAL5_9TELE|nr:hypothetical protein EYF80_002408 [Liparis tanakae]